MSYPTSLYYHFISALELKHIADWQDGKNNDNEICINENLNSSLSNFGKLVRSGTPECYLSCDWQETRRWALVKSGTAKQSKSCTTWFLLFFGGHTKHVKQTDTLCPLLLYNDGEIPGVSKSRMCEDKAAKEKTRTWFRDSVSATAGWFSGMNYHFCKTLKRQWRRMKRLTNIKEQQRLTERSGLLLLIAVVASSSESLHHGYIP